MRQAGRAGGKRAWRASDAGGAGLWAGASFPHRETARGCNAGQGDGRVSSARLQEQGAACVVKVLKRSRRGREATRRERTTAHPCTSRNAWRRAWRRRRRAAACKGGAGGLAACHARQSLSGQRALPTADWRATTGAARLPVARHRRRGAHAAEAPPESAGQQQRLGWPSHIQTHPCGRRRLPPLPPPPPAAHRHRKGRHL